MTATRKSDTDENPKGGGGPGGVARESAIAARGFTLEEAAMVRDVHDRGGARDFVGARTCPPSLLRAMAARGLIETRQGVRGGWELMLTSHGVERLPAALQLLAAEVAVGRR